MFLTGPHLVLRHSFRSKRHLLGLIRNLKSYSMCASRYLSQTKNAEFPYQETICSVARKTERCLSYEASITTSSSADNARCISWLREKSSAQKNKIIICYFLYSQLLT